MILLLPTGGLGNRLLAIDSAKKLSKNFRRRLVIFWVMDAGCNCSFAALFDATEGAVAITIDPTRTFGRFLAKAVTVFFSRTTVKRCPNEGRTESKNYD